MDDTEGQVEEIEVVVARMIAEMDSVDRPEHRMGAKIVAQATKKGFEIYHVKLGEWAKYEVSKWPYVSKISRRTTTLCYCAIVGEKSGQITVTQFSDGSRPQVICNNGSVI